MDNKLLDKIAQPFNADLPQAETMDSMLDQIIPQIRQHSEDLNDLDEGQVFVGKHYLQMTDNVHFHSVVWHMFTEDEQYKTATNGNISSGEWQIIGSNKMIIGRSIRDGTLYELAFLDDEFFILSRHGNVPMGENKYFVLVVEYIAKQLEWNEAANHLFNKYRNSNNYIITIAVIVLLIIAIVLLLS